jgi:KUP system potassium uptake protein
MGWSDAEFAGCKDTRKSRAGYVFTLHVGAVSWASKQQTVVALSTAESEYMGACSAAREGTWLKRVCLDLGVQLGVLVLHMDNQAAMTMANNGALSARTKHIDVPYHFVRDAVMNGCITLQFVRSKDNLADVFTKPLAGTEVARLVQCFGVH